MNREVLFRKCSESPNIYFSEKPVLSFQQCEEIQTLLTNRNYLASQNIPVRTDSTGISFELPVEMISSIKTIADSLIHLIGADDSALNSVRIRHYREGDSHPPHCDHFQLDEKFLVASSIINIASPVAGGKTKFSTVQVTNINQRGHIALWFNHKRNGEYDLKAEHEGEVVKKGEKLIAILLFYASKSDVYDMIESIEKRVINKYEVSFN